MARCQMRSPFPGMDPYIEACNLWGDFHDELIGEIKRGLATTIPERYAVRTSERSYVALVEPEGKQSHPFLPDVGVKSPFQPVPSSPTSTSVAEPATEAEPVSMRAFID